MGNGDDLFAMLADLRLSLDARGMRPLCNGARRDVRPSTMARQMSLGRKAYVDTLGRRPSLEDLCDIFAPADADQGVSVAEQRRYWEEWKRSVGIE